MSGSGPAEIAPQHPWRAFLASVGKVLTAWLLLTAATVAIASWLPEGEVRAARRAAEIQGVETPLWLRLTFFACLPLWLTQGPRIARLPMALAVLTALGTCLRLGSAFYDLERIDWRIAICGFWAVVVAAFSERHLRRRLRTLGRRRVVQSFPPARDRS
jgi:hypothetical protein